MVIRAIEQVRTFNTAADGEKLRLVLCKSLKKNRRVTLSFDGVSDVPSSFVNAAIVSLLDDYQPEELRARLLITDSNRQIADMIRRCMSNGVTRLQGH